MTHPPLCRRTLGAAGQCLHWAQPVPAQREVVCRAAPPIDKFRIGSSTGAVDATSQSAAHADWGYSRKQSVDDKHVDMNVFPPAGRRGGRALFIANGRWFIAGCATSWLSVILTARHCLARRPTPFRPRRSSRRGRPQTFYANAIVFCDRERGGSGYFPA